MPSHDLQFRLQHDALAGFGLHRLAVCPERWDKGSPSEQVQQQFTMTINGNIVQLDGTAYQLSQINSVRVESGHFRPAAFLMACLSSIGLLGSVVMLAGSGFHDFDSASLGVLSCLIFLGLFSAALWRFIDGLRRCTLMLTVSNGEVAAMESTNQPQLESIAADLIGAISAR